MLNFAWGLGFRGKILLADYILQRALSLWRALFLRPVGCEYSQKLVVSDLSAWPWSWQRLSFGFGVEMSVRCRLWCEIASLDR
jgi:hypothetical protein